MIPLFDLHCDTLCAAFDCGYSLFSSPLHISFDKCSCFSPYAQIMAIWTDKDLSDSEGFKKYRKIIEFAKNQGIKFITQASQMEDFSLLVSIEDSRIIETDISRIDELYRDGVRFIAPVWKGVNVIGGAWNTDIGLSDFGKSAVKRMLELGITLDVSHCSVRSFYDITDLCVAYGRIPIASHSNSFSVCPHRRNLTNEQFSIIADLGGVVGISLASEHLSPDGISSIDDIIKHIDMYLSLGGENSVSLGCDFDGVSSLPLQIKNISELERLFEKLLTVYGEKIAKKIFRHNSCDLIKRILI